MLSEKKLRWKVAILVKDLDKNRKVPTSVIAKNLLKQLSTIKACKYGYLLAVTKLISIGQGHSKLNSQHVLFPVKFRCKMLKPVADEVMMGVVYKVYRRGAFLKSGPMNMIYLSVRTMPDYHYAIGENPGYVREADLSKIEMGVLVRFRVLDARWIEDERKEFRVLARIDGDGLGPVSLSGLDGMID